MQLQFGIFNYDAYNTYFDETSTLTLAQAGVYTGPDAIEEYVKFADENSPYIQAKREYVQETTMTGFDPTTNICKFTTYIVNGFDFYHGSNSRPYHNSWLYYQHILIRRIEQSPHSASLFYRTVYRGSIYGITNPSGGWVCVWHLTGVLLSYVPF